jgi:hypothetical protein
MKEAHENIAEISIYLITMKTIDIVRHKQDEDTKQKLIRKQQVKKIWEIFYNKNLHTLFSLHKKEKHTKFYSRYKNTEIFFLSPLTP